MVAYLSLKYLANDRIAKLHHSNHGHAGFGSHQIQPLHPILPAVPPLAMVRISVWIGATISAAFYVTAFVLESPWPGESFLEDILSWHYLEFAHFSIPTGVIGILVDWYLLILPIPAVLTLQMSTAKKLGTLIIFMTGGL